MGLLQLPDNISAYTTYYKPSHVKKCYGEKSVVLVQ